MALESLLCIHVNLPYYYTNCITNRDSLLLLVTFLHCKHHLGRELRETKSLAQRNLTSTHRDPILIVSSACNPEYITKIDPQSTASFCPRKLYTLWRYSLTEKYLYAYNLMNYMILLVL